MSDSADPWAIGHQASLSWDFPGKNYGVGCISFSRDLPNPGIEPSSFMPPASELLLLHCSSLYQGRAQVGCTGHLLQAHKPEVTHSIIFKYCRSDKKGTEEEDSWLRLRPVADLLLLFMVTGEWMVTGKWSSVRDFSPPLSDILQSQEDGYASLVGVLTRPPPVLDSR